MNQRTIPLLAALPPLDVLDEAMFAKLLRETVPDLQWSASIYTAMAGVADVVLNDPNNAVTADAVRKALIRAVDDSA